MQFFMSDYCTIKRGPSGFSTVTITIPQEMARDLVDLVEILLHATRWVRTKNIAVQSIVK